MKKLYVPCLLFSLILCSASLVRADVLPYGLKIEKVLDNSAELGDLAQSPTGEIWLLERTTGTIKVFVAGKLTYTLTVTVSNTCESGLLDVAFAPNYSTSGLAFIYYVDPTGKARVDKVTKTSTGLVLNEMILDLGTTPGRCRTGGGMRMGPDGKLYVSVGDLENPGNAQNDSSLVGKVLRSNLDGSVPLDNPSGTLVWAKGFRDGKDLAINPNTTRPNGTVYLADRGESTTVYDEINSVKSGGNYAWSYGSGNYPGYEQPLIYNYNTVPEGIDVLKKISLGDSYKDSLLYARFQSDEIHQAFLLGGEKDTLDKDLLFYDPDGDRDGTADSGCPKQFNSIMEGNDGWAYGGNIGANPAIWRIWRDLPGSREVSAPGSPFQLTVEKQGSDLKIGWENLGTLDVGRPSRNAGQHATRYQIWEGSIPISGSYSHSVIQATDGTADGSARLTSVVTPGAGNRYYLVNAQGDNMEGSLGTRTGGTPRPGATDYCDTIGWGTTVNACAQKWIDPSDTSKELYLTDYNPNSPTYMKALTMSDLRGRVVRIDIAAPD